MRDRGAVETLDGNRPSARADKVIEMHNDAAIPKSGLKLHSLITVEGELRLSFDPVPVRAPGAGEVLVRMEAAPIHPADIMVLFGGADLDTATVEETENGPAITARLHGADWHAALERVGVPLEVGLEGAGLVVAGGDGAEALVGQRVALHPPALGAYGQYCTVAADQCLPLPEGLNARTGAAAFINPLTALAIVETLHQTGERAMVHTAAASTIGQMLVRICAEDGIGLVNIVRRDEQADLLRDLGARYVCNSSAPDFAEQLSAALAETGARVAFDAIGGGDTASGLVAAMEAAAVSRTKSFNAYGSSEKKSVYIYGRLDPAETVIPRAAYGMRWSIEGWAMPPILEQAGEARRGELMQRIAAGLDSTFACHFGAEIPLAQMLDPATMRAYSRQSTGGKYLVVM